MERKTDTTRERERESVASKSSDRTSILPKADYRNHVVVTDRKNDPALLDGARPVYLDDHDHHGICTINKDFLGCP